MQENWQKPPSQRPVSKEYDDMLNNEIDTIFKTFDLNGDGTISVDEIFYAL